MSHVLERWNHLPTEEAVTEILPCCGSKAWANGMAARRPFSEEATLLAASDEIWRNLAEADWMDAFRSHPRIGESKTPQSAVNQSATWSKQEQKSVTAAGDAVKTALTEANREYERRFGHIFIVCATGKSGLEILEILRRRLENDKQTELREAAEQQRQITQIRLKRWLTA
jgi:2-oxo-4-hydroxy-4-carboxy-5-ureidoimidazoline decarboxylase